MYTPFMYGKKCGCHVKVSDHIQHRSCPSASEANDYQVSALYKYINVLTV